MMPVFFSRGNFKLFPGCCCAVRENFNLINVLSYICGLGRTLTADVCGDKISNLANFDFVYIVAVEHE